MENQQINGGQQTGISFTAPPLHPDPDLAKLQLKNEGKKLEIEEKKLENEGFKALCGFVGKVVDANTRISDNNTQLVSQSIDNNTQLASQSTQLTSRLLEIYNNKKAPSHANVPPSPNRANIPIYEGLDSTNSSTEEEEDGPTICDNGNPGSSFLRTNHNAGKVWAK